MSSMTPKEIVAELDSHIIGQSNAKRSVAIALRNRWRRMQLKEELRTEVTPKNILMIGPTGVGKTEIARRLAKLADAPFIKVEATKFTEVGYVGKEVDSIIRDLADSSMKMVKKKALVKVEKKAKEIALEKILDILLPKGRSKDINEADKLTREIFKKDLKKGKLDDKEIEISVSANSANLEIMAPPGMEDMTSQLQGLFDSIGGKKKKKRLVKIKEALKLLSSDEGAKMINQEELKEEALENVEQNSIVFIDEIDKICSRGDMNSSSVSREGVQRDLLPLVEGCSVNTKYGIIKTDHILFIASGAFALAKPSDLIPELQGRLPIRVELEALSADDFVKILTEPNASLSEQYKALLKTEGLNISFTKDGIDAIAKAAWQVNESTENIGARRLHTVMERLMDEISFNADSIKTKSIKIDKKYVNKHLDKLVEDEDLSRFIL